MTHEPTPADITGNDAGADDVIESVRLVPQTPRRNQGSREQLVRRMRDEFEAVPGLSLTVEQAAQRFGTSSAACLRIVCRLVDERALVLTTDTRNQLCIHATKQRPHLRFALPASGPSFDSQA